MKRSFQRQPNIVLAGFMGTGKSSVGRRLSSQLRMRYVDTDLEIERDTRRRITDIFEEDGEDVFRKLESEVVSKVSKFYNHVISIGGGVVLKESNISMLKENGVVFCLTATPEEIFNRVRHHTHRPLLQTPDPMDTIRTMLAERKPFYAKADYMVNTTSRSYDEIISHIKSIFYKDALRQRFPRKKNHTRRHDKKSTS